MAAAASSTRAALRVQTSGRNRPLASANPATMPEGSAAGRSETANTVPEVPTETTTSPGLAPSPRAAAMLSPVPAASTAPAAVWPGLAAGSSTAGTRASWPRASRSSSGR